MVMVTRIINGRRREKERTQRESKNNAHKEGKKRRNI
jgi:hypothetical protein